MKALELSHQMQDLKIPGSSKRVWMMRQAELTLGRHIALAQRLPGEYAEKLVEFQRHVTKLRKLHMRSHI
jgi:hypothetical protein